MDSEEYIEKLTRAANIRASVRRVGVAVSLLVLIGLALFIALQSPLGPESIHYPGRDSALYVYGAEQILDGIMPYRDIFTFTGPVVFIIDTFGYFFAKSIGVWWIEVFFLVATMVILFVALQRSVGSLAAFITCFVIAALMAGSLEGGNQVEEYVVLFEVIGLLGFLEYFRRQKITIIGVYLIGASAAAAFCTKPTTVIFWAPFFLTILVLVFRKEGLGIALTRMVAILLSAISVFVLIVPWLYVNNALASCWDQMTLFYQDYLSQITMSARLDALEFFIGRLSFIMVVCITVFGTIKTTVAKRRQARTDEDSDFHLMMESRVDQTELPFGVNTRTLLLANLVATILLFAAMPLSGVRTEHFVLQGLIGLAIPLAYVTQFFSRGFAEKSLPRILTGAVFLLLTLGFIAFPGLGTSVSLAQAQRSMTPELSAQQKLISEIKKHNSDDDPIIVFGRDCWIYTAANTYSATGYAYQPFNFQIRPDLNEEFYREIKVAGRTFDSILMAGTVDSGIEQYPGLDEYQLIYGDQTYRLYQRVVPTTDPEGADVEGANPEGSNREGANREGANPEGTD